MKTSGYLLYGTSVVLAAAIPYLHVSEQVYGPRQDRLESRMQTSMTELEQRQSRLRERSRELASELDESSAKASELRQRTGTLGETLLRQRSDLESRLTRVESLRERRQSLEQSLEVATSTADARRQRLEEAGRRRSQLQEEIRALRERLESTESEQSFTAADADRLAAERGIWEKRESVEGLPRAAAQGLVGWCDRGWEVWESAPPTGAPLAPESAPDGRGRSENPRVFSPVPARRNSGAREAWLYKSLP